jgi:hypothetical protein
LPILSCPQKGQGHVFSWWRWVKYHHFDCVYLSLKLIFNTQKNRLLGGLGQIETYVKVVLFFSVWLLEKIHDFSSRLFDLLSRTYHQNLLVFLLNVIERMINLLERGFPSNSKLSHSRLSSQTGNIVDDSFDLIGIEIQSFNL